MRKQHSKSFNKISSSFSVIRSNKMSQPGSNSNLNQDEELDTENILGRIGEEEDQSSGSKANSSRMKKVSLGKKTSRDEAAEVGDILSQKDGKLLQTKSGIQSRLGQSSTSSIKPAEESDSFVSSNYSGDELKNNKREFLTSRLFIDE